MPTTASLDVAAAVDAGPPEEPDDIWLRACKRPFVIPQNWSVTRATLVDADCLLAPKDARVVVEPGAKLFMIATEKVRWRPGVKVSAVGKPGSRGRDRRKEKQNWRPREDGDEGHRKYEEAKSAGCKPADNAENADLMCEWGGSGGAGSDLRLAFANVGIASLVDVGFDVNGGRPIYPSCGYQHCYCPHGGPDSNHNGGIYDGHPADPRGAKPSPGSAGAMYAVFTGGNAKLAAEVTAKYTDPRASVSKADAVDTAAFLTEVKETRRIATQGGFLIVP